MTSPPSQVDLPEMLCPPARTAVSSLFSRAKSTARQTSAAGASVTYSFVGRSVGWLSRIGPGEGAVKVYVDGVLASTVDLAAPAATSRQLVFTRTWGSVGTHTIRLVNVGTIGRPVAIIDGFASLDGTVLGAVHVQR